MDQATLVGPDLNAGREILSVLDDAQLKEITSLFVLFPDYSDWRLVLSSPSLDQIHSLKAGKKVHKILQGKLDYGLPPLMIIPARDPFLRDIRKYLNNSKAGSNYMRLGGQTFGKRYVSDAFVIRLPGVVG